jgi:hypothetical protein
LQLRYLGRSVSTWVRFFFRTRRNFFTVLKFVKAHSPGLAFQGDSRHPYSAQAGLHGFGQQSDLKMQLRLQQAR